jgi:hypothetical protein
LYQVLDENGRPIGTPIKASAIYFKPTLNYLDGKFRQHDRKHAADIQRIKRAVSLVLQGRHRSLNSFIRQLRQEQIYVVARSEKDGTVFGLTFVDTKNKSVIDDTHIDSELTAKKILANLGLDQRLQELRDDPDQSPFKPEMGDGSDRQKDAAFISEPAISNSNPTPANEDLISILLKPELEFEQTPDHLRRDKKKKKNQSPKL